MYLDCKNHYDIKHILSRLDNNAIRYGLNEFTVLLFYIFTHDLKTDKTSITLNYLYNRIMFRIEKDPYRRCIAGWHLTDLDGHNLDYLLVCIFDMIMEDRAFHKLRK